MEKRYLAIRSDKKGNIIRTYKNVDFFQFYDDSYTINSNNIYYVYDGKRFNELDELINLIDDEINNNYKHKINGKIGISKKS